MVYEYMEHLLSQLGAINYVFKPDAGNALTGKLTNYLRTLMLVYR